jgi:hypothetical protein
MHAIRDLAECTFQSTWQASSANGSLNMPRGARTYNSSETEILRSAGRVPVETRQSLRRVNIISTTAAYGKPSRKCPENISDKKLGGENADVDTCKFQSCSPLTSAIKL